MCGITKALRARGGDIRGGDIPMISSGMTGKMTRRKPRPI